MEQLQIQDGLIDNPQLDYHFAHHIQPSFTLPEFDIHDNEPIMHKQVTFKNQFEQCTHEHVWLL
jgi:hypothetical protein